jgi:hypothetical protein
MKKQKLQPRDIVELLTPLIDFIMMKHCSLSSLKTHPEAFTKKLKMTNEPIKLTHNGITIAFMCARDVYMCVEKRRRRLVALLEDAPRKFIPSVGPRTHPFAQPNIQELKRCIEKIEGLHRQINSQKCRLYDLEEELQEVAEKQRKLMSAIGPVSLATQAKPTNL